MAFRIGVMISGRGSNLAAVLRAKDRRELSAEVAVVLSDQPTAMGLDFARQANIPIEIVERKPKERSSEAFNEALLHTLLPYKLDLIVLAGFMRIITASFIDGFDRKVLNIHPSLLPAFKGANAQRLALEAGASESGCTVHFVTPDVDSGPIVAQARVPVLGGDTIETLSARILAEEHKILPAAIEAIALGQVRITRGGELELRNDVSGGPLRQFLIPSS